MAVTKKIAVQQMVNQSGAAIDLAVERERDRLLSQWSKSSADWVKMYREASDATDAAVKWCRIHKYLGYPAVFSVGAILGRFVL